jgi:hypothetical protein
MLHREPKQRLGALLVVARLEAEGVRGLAALRLAQLLHPVPDAGRQRRQQLRSALLNEHPHRLPQRIQPLAVREPRKLLPLRASQLLTRARATVQLLERPDVHFLRVLIRGLVEQHLPHQLDRV